MDENFNAELDAWLNNTSDRYVVESTLKSTPYETTEIVYRKDDHGDPSFGPFVRKRFSEDAGRGTAYEQLLSKQAQGIRLAHEPIIYECERVEGSLSVVMEFVAGQTLRELVEHEGPSVNLAARIMPQLCEAVAELHESFDQPLIHRDIKPSNVIVCKDKVVLIDLGIARMYRADATRDTMRYGTPGYAPPEQFGYGQTSTRSDVYAMGMTLAFCLTGQDPTSGLRESGFADPRIPPAIAEVLVRATEFDPTRRHQSARALLGDFQHALGVRTASTTMANTSAAARSQATHYGTTSQSTLQAVLYHPALKVLGTIWNALLILAWIMISISCVTNIMRPDGELSKHPLWYVIVEHVGFVWVPWAAISCLLLFKPPLRKFRPFSQSNWRVELVVCLGIAFASIATTLFVYMAVILPGMQT